MTPILRLRPLPAFFANFFPGKGRERRKTISPSGLPGGGGGGHSTLPAQIAISTYISGGGGVRAA